MRMLGIGAVVFFAISLAGCQRTVTVDISYAQTDQGVWNSGLSSLSTAYLWDTSANTLTQLDDLAWPSGFSRPDGEGLAFNASDIRSGGVTFTGGAPIKEDIVAANAKIANSTSLVVKDYRIHQMRSPSQNLIDLLNASSEQQKSVMRLAEAARPRSALRYVVINRAVTGKDVELRFDNSLDAGASFPIKLASGEFKLEFKNVSTGSFKNADLDKGTPAMIQMKVFRLHLGPNAGQTTFQIVDESAKWQGQLLAALRAR